MLHPLWTFFNEMKCRETNFLPFSDGDLRRYDMNRRFQTQEGKNWIFSSGTLIGWKSGQTTFVPLRDRMEGAWLWTLSRYGMNGRSQMQGGKKLYFAERDKCKPVLLRHSLSRNLEKPLMSLNGTEWRGRGYGL